MKAERAIELLNLLIDSMIEEEGGHANRVILPLLELGFTAEELVEDFQFPQDAVAQEISEREDEYE